VPFPECRFCGSARRDDALHELAMECDAMAAKLEAGEQSSANC
jgi:hypothetical protein